MGNYFITCPKYFIFSILYPKLLLYRNNFSDLKLLGSCLINSLKYIILSTLAPNLLLDKFNDKYFKLLRYDYYL